MSEKSAAGSGSSSLIPTASDCDSWEMASTVTPASEPGPSAAVRRPGAVAPVLPGCARRERCSWTPARAGVIKKSASTRKGGGAIGSGQRPLVSVRRCTGSPPRLRENLRPAATVGPNPVQRARNRESVAAVPRAGPEAASLRSCLSPSVLVHDFNITRSVVSPEPHAILDAEAGDGRKDTQTPSACGSFCSASTATGRAQYGVRR